MANAGATETTDATDAVVKLRSKNGVPKANLATIDSQAQRIWAAARKGEVAPVIIARALTGKDDSKASGGTYATRIGALRLYGVIEKGAGNKMKLSQLGVALSNTADGPGHDRALKEAALGVVAYASFLTRFDGGGLPDENLIVSEIEYEYELSKADAAAATEAFIESAKYAGLVGDDNVVSLGGLVAPPEESAADKPVDDLVTPEQVITPASPPLETPPETPTPPAPVEPVVLPHAQGVFVAPSVSPVALTVKLDMSAWPVDNVVRVLRVLGYEGVKREPE